MQIDDKNVEEVPHAIYGQCFLYRRISFQPKPEIVLHCLHCFGLSPYLILQRCVIEFGSGWENGLGVFSLLDRNTENMSDSPKVSRLLSHSPVPRGKVLLKQSKNCANVPFFFFLFLLLLPLESFQTTVQRPVVVCPSSTLLLPLDRDLDHDNERERSREGGGDR